MSPYEIANKLKAPIAHWSFDEGQGNMALESITGCKDQIEYALNKGRFQSPQNPIWREGIVGTALFFDGYSTYIRKSANEIKKPRLELSILVWIAPRTFDYGAEQRLSCIVNQHNRELREGYILGLNRYGDWSLQLGVDNQWVEIWSSNSDPLPLNQWSFLAATYDSKKSEAKLYLNGEEITSQIIAGSGGISPCTADLLVGRNNQGVILAESFTMNNYGGLMDELVIYDKALNSEEIAMVYRSNLQTLGGKVPDILREDKMLPRTLLANDRHRPQYHLSPRGHWMNEPHGPIFFNGLYHLFYQKNPNGPFWHLIHWGHWVSEDLVHWRDLPPALYPDRHLDPEGVWSGSACLDENGYPALFFTAGNNNWSPNQTVGIARSTFPYDGDNELECWTKHPTPIVTLKKEDGLLGEFRDPFVWQEKGIWFMLVGTGIEGKGGTAATYSSVDCLQWQYEGPLYMSDYVKYPELGTAWELPVLLPLPSNGIDSEKYVFLISPWGPEAKVEVMYWIGTFDQNSFRFTPDDEEPLLIDVGDFHFTGPSGFVDPKTGRTIVFTIAQGERTPEIDYDCGWAHCGGLPVSLSLREDGRLNVEPIEEIETLRNKQLLSIFNVDIEVANEQLTHVNGDMLEVVVEFEPITAAQYGVALRRSPNGEEETLLLYDTKKDLLYVNRCKSSLDPDERPDGVQGGVLGLRGDSLKLRIFIDRSLIEVYANGLKSLTTRTYPSRLDATGLQLLSDSPLKIISLEIWSMKPAFESGIEITK